MVTGNMHPQLKEKLVAQEYGDLNQLASKANQIEQSIHEKELKTTNKGQRSHLILLDNIDNKNSEAFEEVKFEIMGAKNLRGKSHLCPTLKPGKDKALLKMGRPSMILTYSRQIRFSTI